MRIIVATIIAVLGYWFTPAVQDAIDANLYPHYKATMCTPEGVSYTM